jgi:hypothetical protein
MVKVAILHEGSANDKTADKKLISSLVRHLQLPEDKIHYEAFGSKSNFFDSANKQYERIKEFVIAGQIDKLLFIIDADYKEDDEKYKGYINTENSLKEVISQLGFNDIASFYIVCDPVDKTVYLEHLILASLPDTKRKCIENFLECSTHPKLNAKRIINDLYTMAYPEPPYNFDHDNFKELKNKLANLFK